MKKLVKKSMPKTITAFKSCKCKKIKCMSTTKGSGSAGTNAMQAAQSSSTRYQSGCIW
jgi:hypothetical protein